jgi:site-specific recombinase XerC
VDQEMMNNPNHPKKGDQIRVEPIKSVEQIASIKEKIQSSPRNLAIFTLGINTNLRASDLLALNVGDVQMLKAGAVLTLKTKKTQRYEQRTINGAVEATLSRWLKVHPRIKDPEAALFIGQRGGRLTVPALSRMVKCWCEGLPGNYGSHSLRKTFAYHALKTFEQPFHLVSAALGHRDHKTTLAYLGIQDEQIAAVFMNEL